MEKKTIATDVLVVGAGISGLSAALETAETGFNVTLIEKNPFIGGRVAQLNQYFPKLCPPTCGLEINTKRLKENPRITLYTLTEVESIKGEPGNYEVTVKITPRYIRDEAPEDLCEKVASEIEFTKDDDFNYGLNKSKIMYMPYNNAFPMKYVFDKSACPADKLDELGEKFTDCLDLAQKPETKVFTAKSVIWAAGWDPYDANKLELLGYKNNPDVITNVELERLAAPNGPTEGKIQVPGMDKEIKSVAFVQCAGSRDENHLEYCSSICCLASLKQARYIREQLPEAEVHIFYIDIRSYGIFEDFYNDTKEDEKLFFHRGKVAKVFKEHGSDKLTVEAEDTIAGELNQLDVDLVVLATGMKPRTQKIAEFNPELLDRCGFVRTDIKDGIIGCGVCTRPKDVAGVVQESTGAAMKAIHIIKRSK